MNSIRVHYSQLTCQQLQAEQRKKKKKLKSWTHNTDAQFKPHLNGVILFKEFNSTHKKNIPPVLLKQNGIGMAIME